MNKRRFVNSTTNDWGMFPAELVNDKSWQASTGFYPEELPKDDISGKPVITEDSAPAEISEAPKGKPGRKAKNQS